MHKRLEHMKETLMCAVEMQLCDLGEVDTKELGEAIDMIKDLEEAIYYCTVTEAMKKPGAEMEWEMKNGEKKEHHKENGERMYYAGGYPMMYDQSYMYADDGRRRRADGTFYAEGGQSYNMTNGGQNHANSGNGTSSQNYSGGGQNYADATWYPNGQQGSHQMYRDEREGRSYNSRRMYMEAKEMKRDKATQLRELEKYMQELSQDVTEMIADASPEERQYLEKKVTALASKIGAMK